MAGQVRVTSEVLRRNVRSNDTRFRLEQTAREYGAQELERLLTQPTLLERLGYEFKPPTLWQRVRYRLRWPYRVWRSVIQRLCGCRGEWD